MIENYAFMYGYSIQWDLGMSILFNSTNLHSCFEYAEILVLTGPRPDTFSYAELRAATNDFSSSNKLGEGGYGPVYKVNLIKIITLLLKA